jgi:hypothetical protein
MKSEMFINPGLNEYQKQFCRIIIEKKRKHQNIFECIFGTVESVNNRCLDVIDSKGSVVKIPMESIRGIQVNG